MLWIDGLEQCVTWTEWSSHHSIVSPREGGANKVIWKVTLSLGLFHLLESIPSFSDIRNVILYIKTKMVSVRLSRCRSWFQDLDGRTGPGLEIEVPRWKRRTTTTNGGRNGVCVYLSVRLLLIFYLFLFLWLHFIFITCI